MFCRRFSRLTASLLILAAAPAAQADLHRVNTYRHDGAPAIAYHLGSRVPLFSGSNRLLLEGSPKLLTANTVSFDNARVSARIVDRQRDGLGATLAIEVTAGEGLEGNVIGSVRYPQALGSPSRFPARVHLRGRVDDVAVSSTDVRVGDRLRVRYRGNFLQRALMRELAFNRGFRATAIGNSRTAATFDVRITECSQPHEFSAAHLFSSSAPAVEVRQGNASYARLALTDRATVRVRNRDGSACPARQAPRVPISERMCRDRSGRLVRCP